MKKLLSLLAIILLSGSLSFAFPNNEKDDKENQLESKSSTENESSKSKSKKVYICTGSGAYAYHFDSECRGLKNCKDEIIYVTISEAIEQDKRACKICSKDQK